jgi:hypothetical protein
MLRKSSFRVSKKSRVLGINLTSNIWQKILLTISRKVRPNMDACFADEFHAKDDMVFK